MQPSTLEGPARGTGCVLCAGMSSQPPQHCCGTGTAPLSAGHTAQHCPSQLAQALAARAAVCSLKGRRNAAPALFPLVKSWEKRAGAQSCHPGPAVLLLTFGLSLRTVRRIKKAEISFKERQNQNMISSEGRFHALPAPLDFSWWERDEDRGCSCLGCAVLRKSCG